MGRPTPRPREDPEAQSTWNWTRLASDFCLLLSPLRQARKHILGGGGEGASVEEGEIRAEQ